MLPQVHLEYLVERDVAGFEAVCNWADVLSGGEKQRIAMARLFYHAPKFAILDECTSAVSVDVEGLLYTRCRAAGITLLTVSHRQTLWRYHELLLRFDGSGSFAIEHITADMIAEQERRFRTGGDAAEATEEE